MDVYKKITAGSETLFSDIAEGTQHNRRDYLGELKQLANSSLTMGVEVVLWLKFENAKNYAIYSYVTGTEEAYYIGGVK